MQRRLFTYEVELATEDGQTAKVKFKCYWSMEKDNITFDSIAQAAAGREYVKHDKKLRFLPVPGGTKLVASG